MTVSEDRIYSVAICKGAALLDETEKLAEFWRKGETPHAFADRAQKEGPLGNATAYRSKDIVRRVFIPRFLKPNDRPARVMKAVLETRLNPSVFRELVFLFAARNDPLVRDFAVKEFWPNVRRGFGKMDVDSVLSFFSEAVMDGKIEKPWSEQVSKKVARGILGLFRDIGFLRNGPYNSKEIVDYRITDKSIAIISYLIREEGYSDAALVEHSDWSLFGLDRQSLIGRMQLIHEEEGLLIQHAGEVVSIYWKLKSLDHFLKQI